MSYDNEMSKENTTTMSNKARRSGTSFLITNIDLYKYCYLKVQHVTGR